MITGGFFNSLNGDRKYTALQMSELFDGLIGDGVLESWGDALEVTAGGTGATVLVAPGRAYFSHLWLKNDSTAVVELPAADPLMARIDAVVLDFDWSDAVRAVTITTVQGTASASPVPPTMISTSNHVQHPLAYIRRPAGSTVVSPSNITDKRGSNETPYAEPMLRGAQGDPGKSAYQYAVEGGYTGTEAEFYQSIAEHSTAYHKPTGGIPKTDLASAVRTTLDDVADKQSKPSQVTSGTTITLADNTEYRLTNVRTLTLSYPSGNFECWLKITTYSSGTISISFPFGTTYFGGTPTFAKSETWEISIKDKVVVAAKAVSA